MRLLINAIPLLGEESGIGNYTRHIAAAAASLPQEFETTFFYGYPGKKLVAPPDGGSLLASIRGFARKAGLARRVAKKTLSLLNLAANAICPREWECYFEPNFVFLPTLRARRKILTVHDFSCFRYPQWHPVDRVAHMEKFFWQSVEQADHIITVSETIRQEGRSSYGMDIKKMTAIPNGVDHSLFRPFPAADLAGLRRKYGLPDQFVLYVGALEPRKNLVNLLRAHSALPVSLKKHYPLLLIGSHGWSNSEILDLAQRLAPHVRLLGYAPRQDLPLFFSAASLFAYPSWYEGFGLPALEAMACGRAVLTSADPALNELCGDAALHAEAGDVPALTEKMRELLEDDALRKKLEKRAIQKAAEYSWQASAARHLEIFRNQA